MVKSKRRRPTMAELRRRLKFYGGKSNAKTREGLKAAIKRAKLESPVFDVDNLPGRRRGRFLRQTGIPCMWMPDDTLLQTADRLGLKRRSKNYRASKKALCAKISAAIARGASLGFVGLTPQAARNAFLKEHPQSAIKHAKKVHKKIKNVSPNTAAALAHAHNVHLAETVNLHNALDRISEQLENARQQHRSTGPGWRQRWENTQPHHQAQAAAAADSVHPTDVAPSAPIIRGPNNIWGAPTPVSAPVPQYVPAPTPVSAPVPQYVPAPTPVSAPVPQYTAAPDIDIETEDDYSDENDDDDIFHDAGEDYYIHPHDEAEMFGSGVYTTPQAVNFVPDSDAEDSEYDSDDPNMFNW